MSQALSIIPPLLAITVSLVYNAITALFTRSASTYERQVSYSLIRAVTFRLSITQLQYLQGTAASAVEEWNKQHPEACLSSETIGEGAKVHWMGKPCAARVLLHLHGGGYILPLSVGHLKLASQLRQHSLHNGIDMTVAMVEYTTSPQAGYPVQFKQGVAALAHLLNKGINPSSIILSGDSAGGHIALCIVSHLLRPHPLVQPLPALVSPLAALVLISPCTTIKTTSASFEENTGRDVLSHETLTRWINNFESSSVLSKAGILHDGPYIEPLDAPEGWWDRMSTMAVNNVFICTGEHECFRDDIVAFANKWRALTGLDITLVVEPQGVHDSLLMDANAERTPTDLLNTIQNWLINSARQGTL